MTAAQDAIDNLAARQGTEDSIDPNFHAATLQAVHDFIAGFNPQAQQRCLRSKGYASYNDAEYTDVSPFVVSQGNTENIPNDALGSNVLRLPFGSTGLYDGTVITPDDANDAYVLRVSFDVFSSSQNGAYAVDLNIGTDLSPIIISSVSKRMLRGSGLANTQPESIVFPIFTGTTFLANGGKLRLTSVDGDTSIYNIRYYINKTDSGYVVP